MRVHVEIDFEDYKPSLRYSFAIDKMMEDDLHVPTQPRSGHPLDVIDWQRRKEKQAQIVAMISSQIALAFGHGMEAPRPSLNPIAWPGGDVVGSHAPPISTAAKMTRLCTCDSGPCNIHDPIGVPPTSHIDPDDFLS